MPLEPTYDAVCCAAVCYASGGAGVRRRTVMTGSFECCCSGSVPLRLKMAGSACMVTGTDRKCQFELKRSRDQSNCVSVY